jgi:hypothetical protein
MRNFDYSKKWEKLLTPEIVALLTQIHEYKGEQSLFIEAKADTLTQLVEIAKIQRIQNLLLLIKCYVGILSRFQYLIYKCEQECYDNNYYS